MIVGRLKAFAAFWYDFVVGDDWRVAVGVILALALTYVLAHHGSPSAWWVVLAALVVLLPLSIWRAARKSS